MILNILRFIGIVVLVFLISGGWLLIDDWIFELSWKRDVKKLEKELYDKNGNFFGPN
jgi:hypothetical protein